MKRPLFGAVISFALGEVAYLYTGRMIGMGIVFAMLVCCVVLFKRKCAYASSLLVCALFMALGMINISCRHEAPKICSLLADDAADCSDVNAESAYSYDAAADKYEVFTYGSESEDGIAIEGYGRVIDVSNGNNGSNVVVRMMHTDTLQGAFEDVYKLMIYGADDSVEPGMWVSVSGNVRMYSHATNPGGFDMRNYYMADGIYLYMNTPKFSGDALEMTYDNENIIERAYWRYCNYLWKLGRNYGNQFRMFTDEDTADIYCGVLLGDKSGIDADTKQLYRINGIAHILAISGLHISIIGGMLYKLLRRIGLPFLPAGAMAIIILVSYGELTGFASATLRAVIMLCLYLAGEVIGRHYDMLTGLAVALFFILVQSPYHIIDGGTILSFAAMAGVAMGRYILALLNRHKKIRKMKSRHRLLYALCSNLLFSVCVNVITAPVIVRLYYELPLYSLLVNMLVIPLMSIVVVSGIASLTMSYISIRMAEFVILPGEKIFALYEIICEKVMLLPYSSINVGYVAMPIIVIYYIVICILLMTSTKKFGQVFRNVVYKYKHIWLDYRKWKKVYIICNISIILVGVIVCGAMYTAGRKETVVFLDVGQGDGILIRTRSGTSIVIDGGSVSDSSVGEYTLVPALKYMGMADIDYWFVTHADSDHISGLMYILEQKKLTGIKINSLVVSEHIVQDDAFAELIALADEQDINVITMDVADYVADNTFRLTCCHPDASYQTEDKNDASLALSYCSDAYNMLFLGDMGAEAEEHMLVMCDDVMNKNYDVMKVAHHGSKYSICEGIYDAASRGYAVISSGSGNSYGHPHAETIQALDNAGLKILRTDWMGAIMFIAK